MNCLKCKISSARRELIISFTNAVRTLGEVARHGKVHVSKYKH